MIKLVSAYFAFLLLNYCAAQDPNSDSDLIMSKVPNSFEVVYEWQYINFTWPSPSAYAYALQKKLYIPENNAMTGIKLYKNNIYISIPKFRPGVAATLAVLSMTTNTSRYNELLTPFPSWQMNLNPDCSSLQSVQSMEIDSNGIMWVIDGCRINEETRCPTKLVLLDLNRKGKVIHQYTFPNEIGMTKGGFLNDIVIDETDGDFAYITDASVIDPGLIVFSRDENRAWKLRDPTMFAEPNAAVFKIGELVSNFLIPIDGIALSHNVDKNYKLLFFSSLTGYNLYSMSTKILKDEQMCASNLWRSNITLIGKKQSQTDGMICDNKGNLYYTLLPLDGVGKWNINTPFSSSKIIYKNKKSIVWPDSFGFDNKGNLYLLTDNVHKFINVTYPINIKGEPYFRIFKFFTGTQSYLY